MKVRGNRGIDYEIYYINREKKVVIEVFEKTVRAEDILYLTISLYDIGIDRKDGYKIKVVGPEITAEAADLLRKYGYTFIESYTPKKTAEEIKRLIG